MLAWVFVSAAKRVEISKKANEGKDEQDGEDGEKGEEEEVGCEREPIVESSCRIRVYLLMSDTAIQTRHGFLPIEFGLRYQPSARAC